MNKQQSAGFVENGYRQFKRVYFAVKCLAALIAVCIMIMLLFSVLLFFRNQSLEKKVNDARDSFMAIGENSENSLQDDDILKLQQDIAKLNAIVAPQPLSIAYILERLESILPNEIWVNQFVYDTNLAKINLSVQSYEESNLASFLKLLEDEEFFTSIILSRQAQFSNGNVITHQYDIEVSVK